MPHLRLPVATPCCVISDFLHGTASPFMTHSIILRGLPPLAAALALLWHLPSFAAQATNCDMPTATTVQQELLQGHTNHDRETQCSKNPAYQLLLGKTLNELHRYSEAAERLELALLLQPQDAEAQFEFFIALQNMDDTLAAQALQRDLEQHPNLPPAIRQALANATGNQQPLNTAQRSGWQKQVSLTMGHDNNLLASPVRNQFELTLPGGRVPVTLIDGPQAGFFWRLGGYARFQTLGPANGRMWYGVLSGSLHKTPSESRASYAVARGLIENASIQDHGPFLQAYVTAAFNKKGHFYRELGATTGWDTDIRSAGCRLRIGAEGMLQQFPADNNANSFYQGAQVRALCKNWRIETRAGQNRPRASNRPGGMQQQMTLAVSHWRHHGHNRWQMDYEYENTRDQSGYSPLLEHNRKRRIHKHLWRLEYARTFSQLEIFGGVETVHQRANLPLFNTRTQTAYMGLRKTW